MALTSPRRRVAAALAVATLAGAGTAWLTQPPASATDLEPPSSVAAPATSRAPAGETSRTSTAPSGPARSSTSRPRRPSGPPTARSLHPRATQPSRTTANAPLLGRPVAPPARQGKAPAPTTFSIKRLGIKMQVKPEGVAKDGGMAIAPDPAELGWYRYGPRPGDSAGATVLAAHVDSHIYGIGPLAKLVALRSGDVITVSSGPQVHRYQVQTVTATKKTVLDLAALFTRVGPPRLHVVTCGGTFNPQRHHYDENIVVVAVPIR